MKVRSTKRESGFSLLEMMVATALGSVVLAAAVQMYMQGVWGTLKVSQRAELQQDFRAASNLLTDDLSLAGAGLNPGAAIALPTTATNPLFGCDQTKCYINGTAGGNYPKQGSTPFLYGLLPGQNLGPTINGQTTDTVTVIYTDTSLFLNCYTATVTATGVVTFSPPSPFTTWAATGCLPSSTTLTAPQALTDSSVGLTTGDVILLTLNGTSVVAEVTGAPTASGSNYTVPFANSDKLKLNQTSSPAYLNGQAHNATGTNAMRLLVVTYFIDNSVSPPRLMRQVSGHTPMPVAENVVYLKFSYDLFDDSTNTPQINQADGGASLNLLPNQITKINILHMAMNGTLKNFQIGQGNTYQGLDLQTSVSARNLTYSNNYPVTSGP